MCTRSAVGRDMAAAWLHLKHFAGFLVLCGKEQLAQPAPYTHLNTHCGLHFKNSSFPVEVALCEARSMSADEALIGERFCVFPEVEHESEGVSYVTIFAFSLPDDNFTTF